DNVNSFPHQLHDLGARQQCARPSQHGNFPRLWPTIYEKLGNDALTAGRKEFRYVLDHFEQAGFAAETGVGCGDRKQQGRKEREEKIEGNGLRNHAASRVNPSEQTVAASYDGRDGNHTWALYLPHLFRPDRCSLEWRRLRLGYGVARREIRHRCEWRAVGKPETGKGTNVPLRLRPTQARSLPRVKF